MGERLAQRTILKFRLSIMIDFEASFLRSICGSNRQVLDYGWLMGPAGRMNRERGAEEDNRREG